VPRRLRRRSRQPSARRLRVLIRQVAPVLAGHAPMQIDQPTLATLAPNRACRTAAPWRRLSRASPLMAHRSTAPPTASFPSCWALALRRELP
jgi:hypothetical protein